VHEGHILVVDDEPRLLSFLRSELKASGYQVSVANDGKSALKAAAARGPDLVILDVGLPDMDGIEVCRKLRETSRVPILMLTARASDSDKVTGLESGADDYLTKPFSTPELVARVRALLRRVRIADTEGPTAEFRCGDFVIDYQRRKVQMRGEEVRLSATEFKLLEELCRNAGRVLLREELLARVWGSGYRKEVQYVWVYIGYLRNKLEKDPKHPEYILTYPGVGYSFKAPEAC
jgi:two-component system, OmpR family, KDP operon response regulator KdpE